MNPTFFGKRTGLKTQNSSLIWMVIKNLVFVLHLPKLFNLLESIFKTFFKQKFKLKCTSL